LLIPLSFSSLLGGMMTLIGTPPNILIAEEVSRRGIGELRMFSFAPLGGAVLVAGIAYMILIGRHLLPSRDIAEASSPTGDMREIFGLHKRLLILRVPDDSPLDGRTVAESRIQSALGLVVIGIVRGGRTRLAPAPNDLLQAGDNLLVEGRVSRLEELRASPILSLGESELTLETASSADIGVAALSVMPASSLIGRSLRERGFRQRFGGAVVVGIRRAGELLHSGFDILPLEAADLLLLQASADEVASLARGEDFETASAQEAADGLDRHLLRLRVPEGSFLVGKTLAESRIGESFGLMLLNLRRGREEIARPGPDEVFEAGDALIVKGDPEDLEVMRGLQTLRVERQVDQTVEDLESSDVGLVVATIAPTARLVSGSLRDLRFREKYGLNVLAIWRQGKVVRRDLATETLAFGDAILLHGPRERLSVLARERDFLVLSAEMQEARRHSRAPWAVLTMLGVLAITLAGWLPIYIAAVIGATVMILTGCLTITEAYREIEWRAVFLIAGMLPLGIAMEKTGAALLISESVVAVVGDIGPLAIVCGIFLLAVAGAQVMPTAAVALLLAPIAIDTAVQVGISPLSLVMAVAVGASTSFISPVTHPANVLVMGPGGYRFVDYVKVGVPLALVTLLVVLLVLPLVWPLSAG
ncbi:MAG: SLC13 family permease, partial [Acidobacteria bacterium]|nr:SLC13 family permease [Acidobacteriota bacterium]